MYHDKMLNYIAKVQVEAATADDLTRIVLHLPHQAVKERKAQ